MKSKERRLLLACEKLSKLKQEERELEDKLYHVRIKIEELYYGKRQANEISKY